MHDDGLYRRQIQRIFWKKNYVFFVLVQILLRFFLMATLTSKEHWFRWWVGAEQAINDPGIVLYMRPANERRRYNVTSSLNGWAHTQNDPWWSRSPMCICRLIPGRCIIMMTSSNGNIFGVTGPLCREFTAQRPVTTSSFVLFDLRPNKRLSKQSWGGDLRRPLWRDCNDAVSYSDAKRTKTWRHVTAEQLHDTPALIAWSCQSWDAYSSLK